MVGSIDVPSLRIHVPMETQTYQCTLVKVAKQSNFQHIATCGLRSFPVQLLETRAAVQWISVGR